MSVWETFIDSQGIIASFQKLFKLFGKKNKGGIKENERYETHSLMISQIFIPLINIYSFISYTA